MESRQNIASKTNTSSYKEYNVGTGSKLLKPSLQRQESFMKRSSRDRHYNAIGVENHVQHQQQENFEKIVRKQEHDDTKFIKDCLNNHMVFFKLKPHEQQILAGQFFYCKTKKSEFVIKQGDSADTFFLLHSGSIQVIINNQDKKVLGTGEGFGELALLYNAPRSASCLAKEDSFFWAIDRQLFKDVVNELVQKESSENRGYLEKVTLFHNLTETQKNAVSGVFIEQKFKKDECIVNDKDLASSFYIIKQGSVGVVNAEGKELKVLESGQSFGESALMSSNSTRTMTIKAKEETLCLAIGRETINQILGQEVESLIQRNVGQWCIEKTFWGKFLEHIQLSQILDVAKFQHLKDGQAVISKGQTLSHQLVLCLSGNLGYRKDQKVLASKFENIGEMDVFELLSNKSPDDIVGINNATVGVVSLKDLTKAVGGALKDVVQQHKQKKEMIDSQESQIANVLKDMKIKDFYALKHLGSGQFGNVYLVKQHDVQNVYALKCIQKEQVLSQHLEKYVIEEKQIMEYCNFPFIMRYFRTFQDEYYIFFLLEFICGMELFDVIREIGLLSSFDAQFYTACALCAIEYLHKNHIVYRDIKPENIMGYAKLVDMGTAHQFKNGHRTVTIIGTPHYMAPEVLSGKGYSYYADLWSLGCMLFEFLGGGVPFGEECEDPYEIYEVIQKSNLVFPNFFEDKNAQKLCEQLLSKQPELRLGGSYGKIKRHVFFTNFDWLKFLDGTMKSPWSPPSDKVFTPEQIGKMENKSKNIHEELKEHYTGQPKKSKKLPDWDKGFDF